LGFDIAIDFNDIKSNLHSLEALQTIGASSLGPIVTCLQLFFLEEPLGLFEMIFRSWNKKKDNEENISLFQNILNSFPNVRILKFIGPWRKGSFDLINALKDNKKITDVVIKENKISKALQEELKAQLHWVKFAF
jgi:hypothetical protein